MLRKNYTDLMNLTFKKSIFLTDDKYGIIIAEIQYRIKSEVKDINGCEVTEAYPDIITYDFIKKESYDEIVDDELFEKHKEEIINEINKEIGNMIEEYSFIFA